ncbi:TonB-dependent receptor plug domain-containing protein [Colwellia sp. Arc7-D]|uniref:TonB-dependent receptor plug domain-containing protein n=1 Tax=Colwellia sp. Arc7-D TaxID=2161872 RepID=UPI0013A55AFE|nr:TonB-dependent receptor plug domain-containing protein [Colwellia sp. Arc7-D]
MKLNKISNVLRVNRFNSKGTSALLSSAFVTLLAAPVYAEEQASTNEVAKESNIEVIEVSGMRGTMTRSLNEKKNTAAIVDAIAAADFGDLPGLSLADIIENISGASSHRLKGSQNEVSIRGLGSYWVMQHLTVVLLQTLVQVVR